MKYFVTSDTHSFFNEMQDELHLKGFEEGRPDHRLIICGDIFDRGNQSVEMYNYLKNLDEQFIYVRGNHEDLFDDCLFDFERGCYPKSHHWSNGTVKTLCNLAGYDLGNCDYRNQKTLCDIVTKGKEVSNWIYSKAIDYYTVGDYVFVHGWIPAIGDSIDFFGNWKNPKAIPMEEWSNCSEDIWNESRWENGMDMWKKGVRIPNKTIICGHFHSSWGHSHLHQDRKEFPDKNRKNWQKSFVPFVDDGIIAIDSCCAYSGFLNCITLEIEDEE